MPKDNSTLKLIGIPDDNIQFSDVLEEYRGRGAGRRKYQIIIAKLTYPRCQCPNCGYKALRPNGFKLTHIRVKGALDIPTVIDLKKQRWFCTNCQTTCTAETSLVKPNHSIATSIRQTVLKLAYNRYPFSKVAALTGISAASVQRIFETAIKYEPARKLPKHLCFDEFRSTQNMMSFICIDGDTHKLVTLLGNRQNKTIKDFFLARYSLKERSEVQTITMDMNAAYKQIVHTVFPHAQIIIDRFHIIQLLGRAVDQERIACLKSLSDHHSRIYKVLKPQWRLFHKASPDAKHSRYLMGLNEYCTEQNALDIAFSEFPRLASVYNTYQAIHDALMTGNTRQLWKLIDTYQLNGTPMDTAIRTLKDNLSGVLSASSSNRSNGPIEGQNRLIKCLKRSCFGFRNQKLFFARIYQMIA